MSCKRQGNLPQSMTYNVTPLPQKKQPAISWRAAAIDCLSVGLVHVPMSWLERYFTCSAVSVSIPMPIVCNLSLATQASISAGTL